MAISDVKMRLLEYLHAKRMTQLEFTRRLGVSSTYIGAMRRSISDEKVAEIRKIFPDLNTTWLLYGEGEMLVPTSDTALLRTDGLKSYEVPLLPVAAYAGNLQLWSQGVALKDCEKIVAPVRGADFAIRVSGDSMEPELHDGSTIFIKRINDRAFIPWGNSMVIDTENGVLVKSVYPAPDNNGITKNPLRTEFIEARSLNPKYPPITIPASSIFGLYRILGNMRVYTTM